MPKRPCPLESAIEEERSRLSRARAVLGCLQVALLSSDRDDEECDVGDFSDAAAVARELIGESVERLDSANIGPLMRKLRIRESVERYLCRRFESDRWTPTSANGSGDGVLFVAGFGRQL